MRFFCSLSIKRFVNMSCQRITSPALATLALVSKSTLILESNMTPVLVSMVWISTLSWDALDSTFLNEKGSKVELGLNTL